MGLSIHELLLFECLGHIIHIFLEEGFEVAFINTCTTRLYGFEDFESLFHGVLLIDYFDEGLGVAEFGEIEFWVTRGH